MLTVRVVREKEAVSESRVKVSLGCGSKCRIMQKMESKLESTSKAML